MLLTVRGLFYENFCRIPCQIRVLEICTRLCKFAKICVTAHCGNHITKELYPMPAATETYITAEVIASFRSYLISEEKSSFTIDKYIRDVTSFAAFLGNEPLSKEKTLAYKSHLMECGKFADSSINSMITSILALLKRCRQGDYRGINALNKNL